MSSTDQTQLIAHLTQARGGLRERLAEAETENKKLKEELDVWVNPTGDVVMNREGMMLYEATLEENKKLKLVTDRLVANLKEQLAEEKRGKDLAVKMNAIHVKELDEVRMKLIEETGKSHDIGVMVIDRMKEMDYCIPTMARHCGMFEGAETNYVKYALDQLKKAEESKDLLVEEKDEEIQELQNELEERVTTEDIADAMGKDGLEFNFDWEEEVKSLMEIKRDHGKVIGHIGRLLTEEQKGQLLGEAMMNPDEQAQDIHDYLDKIAQVLKAGEHTTKKFSSLEDTICSTTGWGDFINQLPADAIKFLREGGWAEEDLEQEQ